MSNYQNIKTEDVAGAFHALANPHRLEIFLRLASCCPVGQACAPDMRSCVGDVAAGLNLAPSTVSHHLKELRRAGLIHMERAGQTVECWVEPERVAALAAFFERALGAPRKEPQDV